MKSFFIVTSLWLGSGLISLYGYSKLFDKQEIRLIQEAQIMMSGPLALISLPVSYVIIKDKCVINCK